MKKYNIIYADPPWSYSKGVYQNKDRKTGERLISDFYTTMSKTQLEELPIKNISDKDAALFMWSTYSHLKQAISLCEKWGFKYKTVAFVWLKLSSKGNVLSNIGSWTMGNTECVLLATKGNMLQYKKANNIKQIIMPLTKMRERGQKNHSKKPDIVRDRIVELFGDLPRIELFAREQTEDWDAFGNEIENSIRL